MDDKQDLTMSCLFAREFDPQLMIRDEYLEYIGNTKNSELVRINSRPFHIQELLNHTQEFSILSYNRDFVFETYEDLNRVLLDKNMGHIDPYSQMHLCCDRCGCLKHALNTSNDYGLCSDCDKNIDDEFSDQEFPWQ